MSQIVRDILLQCSNLQHSSACKYVKFALTVRHATCYQFKRYESILLNPKGKRFIMPPQVRQAQTHKPLTREEAIAIAKAKSHQRLKAQSNPNSSVSIIDTEEVIKPGRDNQNIQIQLVKKAVPIRNKSQLNPSASIDNQTSQSSPNETEHITKGGLPDKRFSENKVPQGIAKSRNTFGVHRTKSGAPDRRFLENQHLTATQAEIEQAKELLRRAGIKVE